jgi:hypothetical protein
VKSRAKLLGLSQHSSGQSLSLADHVKDTAVHIMKDYGDAIRDGQFEFGAFGSHTTLSRTIGASVQSVY